MASSASFNFGDLGGLQPVTGDWGFSRGQPIDRPYVESFLSRHAHDVRGHVLEIADDAYTRRFGGARVAKSAIADINAQNPKATIVADLTDAPQIPDDTFDCVVLTQVLELVYNVDAALRTIARILRPGGVALITVPGISQISANAAESAAWSWSFYPETLRRLLTKHFDSQKLVIESYGNVKTTIAFLAGLAQQDLAPEDFHHNDSRYPLIVAARAIKPGSSPQVAIIPRLVSQPEVSVLMPMYNASQYVGEAIESLRSQSFGGWELIIVDDGSTDTSFEIAGRYARREPDRIRLFQHPDRANHGLSRSINMGLSKASGNIVAFLDADDAWMPERLAHDVSIYKKNPSIAAVISNSLYWWTDEIRPARVNRFQTPLNCIWPPRTFFESAWLRRQSSVPCPVGFTVRTNVLRSIGGYDEDYFLAGDMRMIAEISFHYPVYVADACNTEYRRTSGSLWSQGMSNGRDAADRRRFLSWMRALIDRDAADDPMLRAGYIANLSHASAAPLLGRTILHPSPASVGRDPCRWSATLWLEAGRYALQVVGTRIDGEADYVLEVALPGGACTTAQGTLPPASEAPGGPRIAFEVPAPAGNVTITVAKIDNCAALLHVIEVRAEGWAHELPRVE
jgi:glycosyltransferase involved in cell wall biosynthesis